MRFPQYNVARPAKSLRRSAASDHGKPAASNDRHTQAAPIGRDDHWQAPLCGARDLGDWNTSRGDDNYDKRHGHFPNRAPRDLSDGRRVRGISNARRTSGQAREN
jgi:hypothetical protein